MRCRTALERMLDAEPAALRGEDGGELAEHVAGCARCARIAATLLEETDTVDRALGEWAESAPADAAADAALAAVRAAGTDGVVPLQRARDAGAVAVPRAPHRTWLRRAWVPLAAAAALAGVVFMARDQTPLPPATGPDRAPFEPRVAVTPPPDRSAAIMETENPNITIVWLYEREGS